MSILYVYLLLSFLTSISDTHTHIHIYTINLRSNIHFFFWFSLVYMCPFVCSSYNINMIIITYNGIRTCYILKTETLLFFCSGEWTCYAYVHRTARNICPKGNMCSVPFCFLSFFYFSFCVCFVVVCGVLCSFSFLFTSRKRNKTKRTVCIMSVLVFCLFFFHCHLLFSLEHFSVLLLFFFFLN